MESHSETVDAKLHRETLNRDTGNKVKLEEKHRPPKDHTLKHHIQLVDYVLH